MVQFATNEVSDGVYRPRGMMPAQSVRDLKSIPRYLQNPRQAHLSFYI